MCYPALRGQVSLLTTHPFLLTLFLSYILCYSHHFCAKQMMTVTEQQHIAVIHALFANQVILWIPLIYILVYFI